MIEIALRCGKSGVVRSGAMCGAVRCEQARTVRCGVTDACVNVCKMQCKSHRVAARVGQDISRVVNRVAVWYELTGGGCGGGAMLSACVAAVSVNCCVPCT